MLGEVARAKLPDMRCENTPNLSFCGEVLETDDVDGEAAPIVDASNSQHECDN